MLSKLKEIAAVNFKVAQIVQFFYDGVENIVGKEENCGYLHFLLVSQCLNKPFSKCHLKSVLC